MDTSGLQHRSVWRRRHQWTRRVQRLAVAASCLGLVWCGWNLRPRKLPGTTHPGMAAVADGSSNEWPENRLEKAKFLLTEDIEDKNHAERLSEARDHLEVVVKEQPSLYEAQAMLFELLVKTGETTEAFKRLHETVAHLPELRLILAQLYESMGNPLAAREYAHVVIDDFRSAAMEDVSQVQARVLWAEAKLLLGDLDAVDAILAQGRSSCPDPRYDGVLVKLFMKRAKEALAQEPSNHAEAITAWESVLKVDPGHTAALRELTHTLAHIQHQGRIRDILDSLRGQAGTALPVYQILSGLACQEEAWQEAIVLCEEGLEHHPSAHGLMNNLAWALANRESADLDRALRLAERAVEAAKNRPVSLEYAATRGIIKTLLGRWKEAIPDLEKVLRHMPDRRDLHEKLVQCYDQLGYNGLAATLEEAWSD